MILIFTNREDAHPNPVIDILTERGEPFFRLNTEVLLTDYSFSWWKDSAGIDFEIIDLASGKKCLGSKIKAIWDRRPEAPSALPLKNTKEIDAHNLKEAGGFLSFLRYYLKDIPSIGSITGDRIASSKMLQYSLARQIGLTVPDTVFSNRKVEILRLCGKYPRICLKSIDSDDVWDENNGVDYVFYSQVLDSETAGDIPEEAFTQTVSFAQEYVPKAFELRVTIVGGGGCSRVFATRIDSQELAPDKGGIDWRQGYGHGMELSTFELPADIASKCTALVEALGLDFGCIDLVVRPDGEYVFLECNPNGQWLWVEIATGQKISEAIADFLIERQNKI
jgi:glutathione synthase/RimK-type ligase-like ATP-grasp enzyme